MWMHFLLNAGIPALLMCLVLFGVWGWRMQALAFAATAAVVSVVGGYQPQWPWSPRPLDSDSWLLWSTVGSGLLGSLRDLRIVPPRWGDALAWAALVALGWLVIRGLRWQHAWEVQLIALGAGWLVLGFVYAALRAAVAGDAGAGGCIGVVAVLLGDSLAVGSPILLAGVVVMATATITGCWRPPVRLGEGASLAVAAAHSVVPVVWLSGDAPRGNSLLEALLLGLGPVLLLLALRRVVVRRRSFGSPSLIALGTLCWALIVFGLASRPNLL
jgi:hypothetical protein